MKIFGRGLVSGSAGGFFSYSAWPSVCTDENGVIYAVCSGFRMGHMCPFGKIVLYKSRDGGAHFSVPSVVCDSYLDDRDPGILYLGGGRMLVTHCRHHASTYVNELAGWIYSDSGEAGAGLLKCYPDIPENERYGGCFYRVLSQYGELAGEDKEIPVHSTHGPIMLENGDIFYLGKEVFLRDSSREECFSSYISTDGGETFVKNGDCPVPRGYSVSQFYEVHCAQLDGGRIIALFRTHLIEDDDYFTIMKTCSDDGGKTWSEWEKTGICGSPPHLCKMKDGTAVLTYARRVPPYGIYAREVSGDGSISGTEHLLAECLDSDIGYPASAQLPDGKIFTVYYARQPGEKNASIQFVSWSLRS